ncbi:MAG: hypothetical protein AABX07_06300 [Nanoarchaeota archaeon]
MVIKDKKGDTTAWGVIISIVLALVVVWLVYSFITGSFNPLISATKNLPQEAQIAISACNLLSEAGDTLNNAYCTQTRNAPTSDKKVTCSYLNEEKLLTKSLTCTGTLDEVTKKACVADYQKDGVNAKLYVNNKKCANLVTCDDLGGNQVSASNDCVDKKAVTGLKDLAGSASGSICCI